MLSGGSAQPTFEYTLDRVMKYREMLNAEVDSLIDKKKDIKKTFELLHDDRQKLVLYKRYINFQTIESIAEDLDITPRQVYKIYKKSLEKLQKFIEVQYWYVLLLYSREQGNNNKTPFQSKVYIAEQS